MARLSQIKQTELLKSDYDCFQTNIKRGSVEVTKFKPCFEAAKELEGAAGCLRYLTWVASIIEWGLFCRPY